MNTHIHRLLDDAFDGIPMTPDAQDLKEEVRANLLARTAELEASGHSSADAAALAIAELGDVRALLGESTAAPADESEHALYLRHHVKPKVGFVVRAFVWSIAAVVGIVVAVLGATGVLPLPIGPEIGLLGFASTALGLLVGDSVSQETTTNHPMPQNRAGGYFLATLLGAYGLGFGMLVAVQALPMWGIVLAAIGVIAAIVLFAFLGASQTNRRKAWVRELHHGAAAPGNRFSEEPETAARYGIYTAAIWTVGFGVFLVLGFTVGWWWAPLALLGAFVAMLLTLARMLFGPRRDAQAGR